MKVDKAEFVKSVLYTEDLPDDGLPEVAFAGRSNVGKSSLINTLLKRRGLARTSRTPGRTRAINLYLVNNRIRFVDLPGYGYARVPDHVRMGWKGLIESYFEGRKGLCLVVVILDIRRVPGETEREFIRWIAHKGVRGVLVANKADKLSRQNRIRQLSVIEAILGSRPIQFSSITGEGKRELWREIDRAVEIFS